MRDDSARDKLRAEVGDIGLIMSVYSLSFLYIEPGLIRRRTLYESKGLEFNDVKINHISEGSCY